MPKKPKNKAMFWISVTFLTLVTLGALLAAWLVPFDPCAVDLDNSQRPPSLQHWMGTDYLGRDVLARTLVGARVSLAVGFLSALLALGIGTVFGMVAGYLGGAVDKALLIACDVVLAFPQQLLAIAVAVLFQGGIVSVCLALSIVGWAGFARGGRGNALGLKQKQFILAARAMGCSTPRVLGRHMLPHLMTLVLALAGLRVGGFILGESALSFLGLGVAPPTPSWGSMVHAGMTHLRASPWVVIFPGLALSLTILACNVIGDYAHDRLGADAE